MLTRMIGGYTDMGSNTDDNITVSFTSVFTTDERGQHGFLMQGHCGDLDTVFLEKWHVPYEVLETDNKDSQTEAMEKEGGMGIKALYECLNDVGPDPELNKFFKTFLTHQMQVMIVNPFLCSDKSRRSHKFGTLQVIGFFF